VKQLLADQSVRVNDIAECIGCDPILAIELLRQSNSIDNSTAQAVSSLKQGVTALGVEAIGEMVERVKGRPRIPHPEVAEQIEICRERALNVSALATLIAHQVAREKVQTCSTAALLSVVGEMVVIAYLKDRYLPLARQYKRRSQIMYRLGKDFQIDPDVVRFEYLRHRGIPQEVYSAFLEEADAGAAGAGIVRMIVIAAMELVEAHESEKLSNYEPGRKLPPKSPLRMMQLSDAQYEKLFKLCERYLQTGELEFELDAEEMPTESPEVAVEESEEATEPTVASGAVTAAEIRVEVSEAVPVVVVDATPETHDEVPPSPSKIESAVGAIVSLFDEVESKADVVELILESLIEHGHFARTALLAIDKEKREAVTIAACGENTKGMTNLSIRDPLSPLLQSLSKVQSCSRVGVGNSPFGSPTFALAPIDAGDGTPVVLYADCGHGEKIGLAARRIFREVIGRLNEVLPNLPGKVGSE